MKPPESPRARLLFWLLIAATAAGRLAIALADHRSLIANDIFQDDAFYSLKIAANVVAGRGFTFDGQSTTSGFQPLVQLLLVPVVWLTSPSLTAPIRVSALLLAGCAVVTGFVLFRLSRRIGGTAAGLAALGFWALSPMFVIFGLNGQETGLAILLAVAVLLSWLRLRGESSPPRRAVITAGLLCGLGVLARLDLAILLAAVACDWCWSRLVRREKILPARSAAVVVIVAGAVWGSWASTSRWLTGDWMPRSGSAGRQIALNYGWQNLPRVWSPSPSMPGDAPPSPYFDMEAVPLAYRLDVATRAVFVLLHDNPMLAALRFGQPFSVWPQLDNYAPFRGFRAAPALGSVILFIVLTSIALLGRKAARSDRDEDDALASFGRIVAVYVGLLVVMYVWYCPVHWYFSRYFVTAGLVTTVLGTGLIAKAAAVLPERQARLRATLLAGLTVLIALQLPHWRFIEHLRWRNAPSGGFMASWEALKPGIPEPARLGTFQAGIISWFSRRDVVNLDGKVNRDAYYALRDHRLDRYIQEQRIEYVLDWDWVIFALCARHAGPEGMRRWELIGRENGGAGMSLWAVHP